MEGRPWHFNKNAMCLSEIQDDGKPSELQLHSLPYAGRVRFYNLPFKGRGNEYNVHMLASKIGTLVKIDKEDVVDINRSVGFVLLLI